MSAAAGDDAALQTFETFLRRKGMKVTGQRRAMVRGVLSIAGHFSADEAHERLRADAEDVSLATVYRALALLEQAGVLEGHDFADGQRRYERALTREHHDHVICIECRAVVEFQNPMIETLQDQVLAQHGFSMVHHALTIFGSCRTLKEKGSCPRRDLAAAAAASKPGAAARAPR